jgi:CHASE3 domain sensor protein
LVQNVALIAISAAVLVGIETYDATSNLPDFTRSRAAVAHTFEVIDTARVLDEAIQDAERNERGFIITGRSEYLQQYTK